VFRKIHFRIMSFFIINRGRDFVNKLILANVANQYDCGSEIDCMLLHKGKSVICENLTFTSRTRYFSQFDVENLTCTCLLFTKHYYSYNKVKDNLYKRLWTIWIQNVSWKIWRERTLETGRTSKIILIHYHFQDMVSHFFQIAIPCRIWGS
jgi:hypothetical protein